MPNPIDPRPITATRCAVMAVLLRERGSGGIKPVAAEAVKHAHFAGSATHKASQWLPHA
jgi:hypothetical protein